MSDVNGSMMSDVIHGPDVSMAELAEDAIEPDADYPRKIERKRIPDDADRYSGYEFEECACCGKSGRVESLNLFEECPDRQLSRNEERAASAREDNGQEVLA